VVRDPRGHALIARVAAQLTPEQLQYSPFGGAVTARRKVASALTRRTGVDHGYQDVFLTPGATAALVTAFSATLGPGDEVLIITPGWMDYPLYLDRLGASWRLVPQRPGQLDPDAIARAWGPRTRALVISQPNCPTGAVYDQDQLIGLAAVLGGLARNGDVPPLLISDEAHRGQTWSGGCPSPAAVYEQTISVHSFGKAWSMQGQRTGYLALSSGLTAREELRASVLRALRVTGVCAPTVLMQHVVAELARLEPDVTALAADQARVRSMLAGAGADVVDARASAFVYVRCPSGVPAPAFARMAADHGVLVLPAELFHDHDHYRIALNVSGSELDDAVLRLIRIHQEGALR
jgi:aspartate aminotransferase